VRASTAPYPSTVAELMTQRGLLVAEADLATALDEALIGQLRRPGSAPLSQAAQQFLGDHGGIGQGETADPATGAVTTTAAHMIALIGTSLTGEQAAARLGINVSTVRGRISRKALNAIRVGRRNRLPLWQFAAEGVLPHLRAVLTALPVDLHPLEVEAFFALPAAELICGTMPTSPHTWLAAGGKPATVVALAASLGVAP